MAPSSAPVRPDAGHILDALDPEQRAAASVVSGPVRVLAGAGTGKTRMLTHRIAYATASGTVAPGEVLAVTFTRRAAGEMRERLRRLGAPGVRAATFHSAALKQLGYFWPRAYDTPLPPLLDKRLPVVGRAASRVLRRSLSVAEVRDLTSEVDWAKASLVSPATYPAAARRAGRETSVDAAQVADVLDAYEAMKGDRLDFDDLLVRTAHLLTHVAPVAEEFRARYRWFTVDEYQDTSPAQQSLLDAWLGDEGRDLCVVGDVAQTIYTFAGADAGHLIGFDARFPEATTVRLVRDYRSTPQVVEVANTILAKARGPAADLGVRLQGMREAGPRPRLRSFASDAAEAAAVAARCGELRQAGVPLSEIAVLVRTHAQATEIETELDRGDIPYVTRGTVWFFDRDEVRQAVADIRRAALGPDTGAAARETVPPLLERLGLTSQPPKGAAARDRWDSLTALRRMMEQDCDEGTTVGDWWPRLQERAASHTTQGDDRVTVSTIHAAKGLEWDAVFVIGVSEGRLPLRFAETPDEVEEERRLLYVAVTRAREQLWLSWARTRSRFLDGLAPVESGATRTTSGKTGAALSGEDRVVFDRLKAWRLTESRSRSVPAFTVFTDETLVRLATERPTTDSDLLAIRGIGPAKAERYGASVLAVLTEG